MAKPLDRAERPPVYFSIRGHRQNVNGYAVQRGRWLPALDDTVRANVPYRNFLAYRKALAAWQQAVSAA